MNILRIAAVVLALVSGSTWVAAQSRGGNPQIGQAIYEQHCLRCHGKALDGNGPEAKFLLIKPANLQSPQSRSKADWELMITIANGALFTPMHGWRERLTDEQMVDVLAYIRLMAPFDAVS